MRWLQLLPFHILHRKGTAVMSATKTPAMTHSAEKRPPTVLTVLLSHCLGRAQSRLLLRGFWVNDGGVAALQVLSDGGWVTFTLLQSPPQEVLVQVRHALQPLYC